MNNRVPESLLAPESCVELEKSSWQAMSFLFEAP
jgi:hypothetical protein